jgi:hypothetical protein
MVNPASGDVLIRDAVAGYAVLDAVSLQQLAGPFPSIAEAALVARDLAKKGHLWRQNLDRRGRAISRPFRLELQPSTLG